MKFDVHKSYVKITLRRLTEVLYWEAFDTAWIKSDEDLKVLYYTLKWVEFGLRHYSVEEDEKVLDFFNRKMQHSYEALIKEYIEDNEDMITDEMFDRFSSEDDGANRLEICRNNLVDYIITWIE